MMFSFFWGVCVWKCLDHFAAINGEKTHNWETESLDKGDQVSRASGNPVIWIITSCHPLSISGCLKPHSFPCSEKLRVRAHVESVCEGEDPNGRWSCPAPQGSIHPIHIRMLSESKGRTGGRGLGYKGFKTSQKEATTTVGVSGCVREMTQTEGGTGQICLKL